jgi:hypothetical protein
MPLSFVVVRLGVGKGAVVVCFARGVSFFCRFVARSKSASVRVLSVGGWCALCALVFSET